MEECAVPRYYRNWFYAATAYNLLWAATVIAFAGPIVSWANLAEWTAAPMLQVLGMMVGVYAYGYWLLARDPVRYAGFVWIGLAGKMCGVVGFLYYAAVGVLPWRIGLTILPNDAIWIPAFAAFAWKYARRPLAR